MNRDATGPIGERPFGFVEWFPAGDRERVAQIVAEMKATGASCLRIVLPAASYREPGGQDWYNWLIPTLGRAFDVLPYLPFSDASAWGGYAGFVDHVLTRHGALVRCFELGCEPDTRLGRSDQDQRLICSEIGAAARRVKQGGWSVVLGGVDRVSGHWLDLLGQAGVLTSTTAVGMRAFPATWDSASGVEEVLSEARPVLDRYNPDVPVWLTEIGYSTWRHDEASQVRCFREALLAPVERFYWNGWQDLAPAIPARDGMPLDPRQAHLGVTDAEGRPKLLRRVLQAGGVASVLGARPEAPALRRAATPIVVFGGAGFIGSNLADAFLGEGREIVLFDSLSRPGVERNLAWLQSRHGARVHPVLSDIRDPAAVREAVRGAAAVFHLAAQVAVTSSLVDPRHDFAVNAEGTLNVLEAVRSGAPGAPVVFASTNKVYGQLSDLRVSDASGSYLPHDNALRAFGVDETRPLDFCTPYGCSKGVADQYVLDYAHSFGLRTAVLRMSCIYGPRQFGTEDQGWIAHFLIRALRGEPITIFGDGKQVRDVLHVSDAVRAYRAVLQAIDRLSGHAFNLGGGPANAVSLHAVLAEIASVLGQEVAIHYEPWRSGDQPYFVADTRRLQEAVGWQPQVSWQDGVRDLADWLQADLGLSGPGNAAQDARKRKRLLA